MSNAAWLDLGRMDELSRLDTPVHRLDARAKVIVTLAFIGVVMSFPVRALSALTPLLIYPVALLSIGRIPPGHILRKILVAAPFALAVGIFNPLLDRAPVAVLGPWVITGGWLSLASLLLRFLLTVSAALALVACTGMYPLGAALERLGVPRVLVVQLLFLYRYLFVVADAGFKTLRAVELRSGSRRALGLRVYGTLLGHLLLRALNRSERIHCAMVARGFDGTLRLARPAAWRRTDWCFVIAGLAGLAAARAWNLAALAGQWVTGVLP